MKNHFMMYCYLLFDYVFKFLKVSNNNQDIEESNPRKKQRRRVVIGVDDEAKEGTLK